VGAEVVAVGTDSGGVLRSENGDDVDDVDDALAVDRAETPEVRRIAVVDVYYCV